MKKNELKIITFGKPDGFKDIHIGHLSGVILHADAYARYCRNNDENVLMISGTDGYGAAVYQHFYQSNKYIPNKDELKSYVLDYHIRQKEMLRKFNVSIDYYGLDINEESTNKIKKLCDNVLEKMLDMGLCKLREEEQYIDPILNMPLGNRQLFCKNVGNKKKYYSCITKKEVKVKNVVNYFLSLEKCRNIVEKSRVRFRSSPSDGFVLNYINKRLENKLPEYRVTSYQPWAISVLNDDSMKYQVWVESLIAPLAYSRKMVNVNNFKCRYVQFISEDTLFFYSIIQPILWSILCPDQELPTLYCNRTRSFVDANNVPCFFTGDELLEKYSVEQIRMCFIGRGVGRTTIAVTGNEMNRLWRGFQRAINKHNNGIDNSDRMNFEMISKYNLLMDKMEFSKVIDMMDEYFHADYVNTRVCKKMMSCITAVYV